MSTKLFLKSLLSITLLSCSVNSFSQNYRNARAYLNDFAQNEIFINSAMMEYTKSIAFMDSEKRVTTTSKELFNQLDKLNIILINHDKGFDGDVSLRDALKNLNKTVIDFFKNSSLSLKDYKEQSKLSLNKIEENFKLKEEEINNLYAAFLIYEQTKEDFGEKFNVPINNFEGKNVFEYNAQQNFIFYKINVVDEKLLVAIDNKNLEEIKKCTDLIQKICDESKGKTTYYKDYFKDNSLNNANINLIDFYTNQNKLIATPAEEFFTFYEKFQITKYKFNEDESFMSVEEYNKQVRHYNELKNKFYNTLYSVNLQKNDLIKNWSNTNSAFLKNNIDFEKYNYKFIADNDLQVKKLY